MATTQTQQQWTTKELQEEFTVVGFSCGFVVVIRKVDGVKGTLDFDHSPRIYFGFQPAN